MLKRIKNWWLDNSLWVALSVSLLIIVASLIPTDVLPTPHLKDSDKLLHGSAYIGLIWVWLLAFRNRYSIKKGIILFLSLSVFGIILEILQGALTTFRTPDWRDALANLVGLVVGLVTYKQFYKLVFGVKNDIRNR